jgi:hypothetical protein
MTNSLPNSNPVTHRSLTEAERHEDGADDDD